MLTDCSLLKVKFRLITMNLADRQAMESLFSDEQFDKVEHPISLYAASKKADELMAI